ncbi:MAG: imidazole glycerol phosphate synthase subunit HisH [Gammaproteobacteria bacterium]
MESVAVIDYGSSNLRSVAKALDTVAAGKYKITVSDDFALIRTADRIVFPGQGAIRQCMQALLSQGYVDLLTECINNKPFLGICLGLQTLLDFSEEDDGVKGLGIIPGTVKRFPDDSGPEYKIPHIGWNRVAQSPHPLWQGINDKERFYFLHSYYVAPEQQEHVAGSTEYMLKFTAAVARDNLFAIQFHPEKSQRAGLQLLSNFLNWRP